MVTLIIKLILRLTVKTPALMLVLLREVILIHPLPLAVNTGADAIQITSRRAGIVDAGDSQVDITAENGGVNLRGVTGIGSTNALEVSTGKLTLRTGSGNILYNRK
jgi:hypothetical protein